MRFVPLDLAGAYLLEPEPYEDERGAFSRIWCSEELADHGLNANLAQCSISRNTLAGTLRGMHFQRAPHEEAKLVRCVRGAIFDVIVDLRPGSPTRAQWFGANLDADGGTAMYVPEGFAHGFQTLTAGAEVLYFISHEYVPESSAGVRWDDPAFGIVWPETSVRTMSERDRSWPYLQTEETVG
jgi:dTDP-4-dehydrorhamnose 3,5-epimerase